MIELQHINVKFLLQPQEGIDLEALIPVFHSWIQTQPFAELLIDVADYRHVPDGPGVMIIGHQADYSVDNTDGRLGVRYNRKGILNSNNQERLRQAARSALDACQKLEQDARLSDRLRFNGKDVEIVINDRLLAPNSPETQKSIEPEIRRFADKLFGAEAYQVTWQSDPRRLTGVTISANQAFSTEKLLERLAD